MDARVQERRGWLDLGEMAQLAAAETMTTLAKPSTSTLFETRGAKVQEAIRSFSIKKNFGILEKKLVVRLSNHFPPVLSIPQ